MGKLSKQLLEDATLLQDISAVEGAKAKMRSKGIDIEDSFVKILKMRAAH